MQMFIRVQVSRGFNQDLLSPYLVPRDVLVEVKAATKREDTLLAFLVKGDMIEKPTN